MTDIVEQVARAKAARIMAETTEEYGVPRWQACGFEHRMPEALADTLAVLDAIVEPNDAADYAGLTLINSEDGVFCVGDVFRAMIATLRNEIGE